MCTNTLAKQYSIRFSSFHILHSSFHFNFISFIPLTRAQRRFSDQNCVKTIYEKLSHLYNRIIKAHENTNNMLDSIRIWAKIPFHQGPESNATSLLDIDDRSLKCNAQCVEVSNSKKLIEYTMEENYRLLFGEPSLERKREVGKDRFRNTIIRKFGRHRAKEKIERLPSMVRYSKIYWTKLQAFLIRLWMFVFLFPFLLCVRFLLRLCHSNLKVELLPTDSSAAVEFIRTEKIAKSAENLKLFRSYEEHMDRLISQALLNGIESRYVCCRLFFCTPFISRRIRWDLWQLCAS